MKPQLDTDTVLTIIKMIENGHNNLVGHLEKRDTNASDEYLQGGIDQLFYLQEHLQEYIEGLVSQAENQLGGGE